MSLEELEKKMAELDELQAETENAHVKLKAQMAELEKLQAETENAHAELIAQIAELKARGEEKPKPPHPRWKPEYKGKYYIVFYNGCSSIETYWTGCTNDMGEYAIGNVFKTKEEAEFAVERLKVIAEMQEWSGNSSDGVYMYYQRPTDEILFANNPAYAFGSIRFKCFIDAEKCVTAVGRDRIKKYYFMIPEEETKNG